MPGWRGDHRHGANETVELFHLVRRAPRRDAQEDGPERRAARSRKREPSGDERDGGEDEHFHHPERFKRSRADSRHQYAREHGRVHSIDVHDERHEWIEKSGHREPRPETPEVMGAVPNARDGGDEEIRHGEGFGAKSNGAKESTVRARPRARRSNREKLFGERFLRVCASQADVVKRFGRGVERRERYGGEREGERRYRSGSVDVVERSRRARARGAKLFRNGRHARRASRTAVFAREGVERGGGAYGTAMYVLHTVCLCLLLFFSSVCLTRCARRARPTGLRRTASAAVRRARRAAARGNRRRRRRRRCRRSPSTVSAARS